MQAWQFILISIFSFSFGLWIFFKSIVNICPDMPITDLLLSVVGLFISGPLLFVSWVLTLVLLSHFGLISNWHKLATASADIVPLLLYGIIGIAIYHKTNNFKGGKNATKWI